MQDIPRLLGEGPNVRSATARIEHILPGELSFDCKQAFILALMGPVVGNFRGDTGVIPFYPLDIQSLCRPVLLIGLFGSAVGYFVFGIGGALWVLFLSRLIDGVTGGNLSTAAAGIADLSKPEERAKNFTLIGIAYGFGFILGPALDSNV